jgi:hypothetical protein
MQYDLDALSAQAELFLHLRSIILSFHQIKEKRNAKQTSYYDTYSAICFLRVRHGQSTSEFCKWRCTSQAVFNSSRRRQDRSIFGV